jgi:hypothetical protein
MSILARATKGKVKVPDKIMLYGVEGVGKSTFASYAPDPYFAELGQEDGTFNLDVTRDNFQTFEEFMSLIHELTTTTHSYKTFVIDSYTQLEKLIWKYVCLTEGVANVEQVGGGYGKGYKMAIDPIRRVFAALDDLREKKGMNIIGIAHSAKTKFTDPATNATYDRYVLSVHDGFGSMLKEWHDIVLFANHKVYLQGPATKKQKAFGDGSRVMYSEFRPGFDAKSRYKIPFELPLSYAALKEHIDSGDAEQAAKIKGDMETLLADCKDESLIAKVRPAIEQAQNNVARLSVLKDRLVYLLKEKEENDRTTTTESVPTETTSPAN